MEENGSLESNDPLSDPFFPVPGGLKKTGRPKRNDPLEGTNSKHAYTRR